MLILIRDIRADEAVLGRLYHNGSLVCYTIENASTLIPCGDYRVQNSKSPKFKRELPLVYNSTTVKASRGIRIHRGNTFKDSQGCVLVGIGRDVKKNFITESALAETMVTMLCRNNHELTICDCMH